MLCSAWVNCYIIAKNYNLLGGASNLKLHRFFCKGN